MELLTIDTKDTIENTKENVSMKESENIKEGIDRNFKRKNNNCPFCKSSNYIRYGKYKGNQRYRCKNCDRTFSDSTMTTWSYIKKDRLQINKFIELMGEKASLRKCASVLNMSVTTAFYWRHKILNALDCEGESERFLNDVEAAECVVRENFKGCRDIKKINKALGRRAMIFIVAVEDIKNKMIALPISRLCFRNKCFHDKIESKIDKKAYIFTQVRTHIKSLAENHNGKLKRKEEDVDDFLKHIGFKIYLWIKDFHGVSSKYLQEYLWWFVLNEMNSVNDYMNKISSVSRDDNFIKDNDISKKKYIM